MTDLVRITGPNFNAELLALVTIDSTQLPWHPTGVRGVAKKLFERIKEGPNARETTLLKLEPGARLPGGNAECRIDLYVQEGSVDTGSGQAQAGMFVRFPVSTPITLGSANGATILLKKRGGDADGQPIALDTCDRANWAAWGERGSEKAQIYEPGTLAEASWVGFMLPNLTIPEHTHAGGEEIFILEGELRDERGHYGPGTWVRFPIELTHTPTSLSQGCRMLVREGDARPLA